MKLHRQNFTLGASALALIAAASPALAQEAAEDETAVGTNPEIVVTAQFPSQKLQDIPLAITAVNA